MIRWGWDEIIRSDASIAKGEWAGVRASWASERRFVGAPRRSVCHTFLFAGCAYVMRLVVAHDESKRPLFGHIGLDGALKKLVERHGVSRSAAILATAAVLVPKSFEDLSRVAETEGCATCSCVFKTEGALNPDTTGGKWVAQQIAASDVTKRNAA